MDHRKLQPKILHDGQPFVDEPVTAEPKRRRPIERAIAKAFGAPEPQSIVVRHERIKLRWLTPDGNGGLKPKYPKREE